MTTRATISSHPRPREPEDGAEDADDDKDADGTGLADAELNDDVAGCVRVTVADAVAVRTSVVTSVTTAVVVGDDVVAVALAAMEVDSAGVDDGVLVFSGADVAVPDCGCVADGVASADRVAEWVADLVTEALRDGLVDDPLPHDPTARTTAPPLPGRGWPLGATGHRR